MATIIERDTRSDGSAGMSAASMVIAFLAIIIVVALALYVLKIYPFTNTTANPSGGINIDVNGAASIPTSPSSGY